MMMQTAIVSGGGIAVQLPHPRGFLSLLDPLLYFHIDRHHSLSSGHPRHHQHLNHHHHHQNLHAPHHPTPVPSFVLPLSALLHSFSPLPTGSRLVQPVCATALISLAFPRLFVGHILPHQWVGC